MSRKHFGTDGIRGVANQKLTPELAFRLGQAAGRWLKNTEAADRVVMGRDTRRSGPMLGAALSSGFCSVGVDVVTLGVAPTGAISYLARTGDFGFGAVISASHNPAPDNGIKFLGHDGCKLSDAIELEIEAFMDEDLDSRPTGEGVGRLGSAPELLEDYLTMLEAIVPERLDGMTLVVDGANGAAYALGVEILCRLGAQVIAIGDQPDGMNINEGFGATRPEAMQLATQSNGAALGIAFDGDADRAVFSDAKGRLINGDRTMAIWAGYWMSEGQLEPKTVVGTVMSNGGFETYLKDQGIALVRASVGDKYVAEQIRRTGARVGGEQSGHIIFPERAPTGDGLITALELLRVMKRSGQTSCTLFESYDPWPQILVNVEVASRESWNQGPAVAAALVEAESALSSHGRLVVRPSGTQPMIRVMVEAVDVDLRDRAAHAIVEAMTQEAGGKIYSQVDLTHALGD